MFTKLLLSVGFTDIGCDDGWRHHDKYCYLLSYDDVITYDQSDAKDQCLSLGGELTSIWDEVEWGMLLTMMVGNLAASEHQAWATAGGGRRVGIRPTHREKHPCGGPFSLYGGLFTPIPIKINI